MAQLQMQAVVTTNGTLSGSQGRVTIVVCVTDENGLGVTGLDASHFRIASLSGLMGPPAQPSSTGIYVKLDSVRELNVEWRDQPGPIGRTLELAQLGEEYSGCYNLYLSPLGQVTRWPGETAISIFVRDDRLVAVDAQGQFRVPG